MKACEQSQGQTIHQHGVSVGEYFADLTSYLRTGKPEKAWRFPSWINEHKDMLLSRILPDDIIQEYALFHDCGKPFCLTVDEEGKRHFPDHAKVSAEAYLSASQNQNKEIIADLILHDMDIHTMKAEDTSAFCESPRAATLLLTGLAEIHSNAAMFGGIDSTSFKIKHKRIEQRGKAICKILASEGI